ncbi:MAG TPA: hypothetical protein VGE63_01935 [Candidatus Paceibacterota bacterium]
MIITKENLEEIVKEFSQRSDIVFHGSPHEISDAVEGGLVKEVIYASDDFYYGAFMAILGLQDYGRAEVGYDNGKVRLSINMQFVNGESRLEKGFLYILDKKDFEDTHNNHEFESKSKQVAILEVHEVDPNIFAGMITVIE